jgi:hypothetical protein
MLNATGFARKLPQIGRLKNERIEFCKIAAGSQIKKKE